MNELLLDANVDERTQYRLEIKKHHFNFGTNNMNIFVNFE